MRTEKERKRKNEKERTRSEVGEGEVGKGERTENERAPMYKRNECLFKDLFIQILAFIQISTNIQEFELPYNKILLSSLSTNIKTT